MPGNGKTRKEIRSKLNPPIEELDRVAGEFLSRNVRRSPFGQTKIRK